MDICGSRERNMEEHEDGGRREEGVVNFEGVLFCHIFLREYQYQIDRRIEWKKNPQAVDMMMIASSSSIN